MIRFPLLSADDAPEASKPLLAEARDRFGAVPNLHRILAASPGALAVHHAAYDALEAGAFAPSELQLLYMAISYENDCRYCMAGHTPLAKAAGAKPDHIAAIRDGTPLADAKLEALRVFAQAMTRERGQVGDAAVEAFLNAGWTHAHVLDVILAISLKVITSYTNHVAATPHDPYMDRFAWDGPERER